MIINFTCWSHGFDDDLYSSTEVFFSNKAVHILLDATFSWDLAFTGLRHRSSMIHPYEILLPRVFCIAPRWYSPMRSCLHVSLASLLCVTSRWCHLHRSILPGRVHFVAGAIPWRAACNGQLWKVWFLIDENAQSNAKQRSQANDMGATLLSFTLLSDILWGRQGRQSRPLAALRRESEKDYLVTTDWRRLQF